jgi:hypothetical protein
MRTSPGEPLTEFRPMPWLTVAISGFRSMLLIETVGPHTAALRYDGRPGREDGELLDRIAAASRRDRTRRSVIIRVVVGYAGRAVLRASSPRRGAQVARSGVVASACVGRLVRSTSLGCTDADSSDDASCSRV